MNAYAQALPAINQAEQKAADRREAGVPRKIDVKDLAYLRFLSVLLNQPMAKLAGKVSRRRKQAR